MNSKVSILVAVGLLACSMPMLAQPPAPTVTATPPTALGLLAPPYIKQLAPLPPRTDANGQPYPHLCHLGSDCLALDDRPFEFCHVATKDCGDKLAQYLNVKQPKDAAKPIAPVQKVSR
jgi:hypothetical protein